MPPHHPAGTPEVPAPWGPLDGQSWRLRCSAEPPGGASVDLLGVVFLPCPVIAATSVRKRRPFEFPKCVFHSKNKGNLNVLQNVLQSILGHNLPPGEASGGLLRALLRPPWSSLGPCCGPYEPSWDFNDLQNVLQFPCGTQLAPL